MRLSKFIFLILIFFTISNNGLAQFNVKVGYGLAYTSANHQNDIIQEINDSRYDYFEQKIPSLHFLHGIHIGVRYKIENVGLEIGWDNLRRDREGYGENPLDGTLITQEFNYSFNDYNFNIDNYFGSIGISAGIGIRNVKISEKIKSSDFKKSIIKDSQINLKLGLPMDLGGSEKVSFILKPYILLPLGSINLSDFANQFNINTQENNERFLTYGISFIFYNGPN